MPTDIDWEALSDRSKDALPMAKLLSDGYSQKEIATLTGRSTKYVSVELAHLRAEVAAQQAGKGRPTPARAVKSTPSSKRKNAANKRARASRKRNR